MSHNLKCVFVQISESLVQDILKIIWALSDPHVIWQCVVPPANISSFFFFFHYCLASLICSLRKCFVGFLLFELWPTMLSTSIKLSSELKNVYFDVVEENIL